MQEQAHALIRQGCVEEGLGLLDETMVAVTADELSPIVTGLVYCNTIAFCQGVFEVGRAREWTGALTRWCEQQPDMVAHTGLCLVHRAEILQLQGAWRDALDEARRAGERLSSNQPAAAARAIARARSTGSAASSHGRRRRTRPRVASAGIRSRGWRSCAWPRATAMLRPLRSVAPSARRASPRCGRRCCPPQSRSSSRWETATRRVAPIVSSARIAAGRAGLLAAVSAQAGAAVALADGDAATALELARHACRAWQQLGAPYDTARARTLVGLACRALGDEDSARLELAAGSGMLAELASHPSVTRTT